MFLFCFEPSLIQALFVARWDQQGDSLGMGKSLHRTASRPQSGRNGICGQRSLLAEASRCIFVKKILEWTNCTGYW